MIRQAWIDQGDAVSVIQQCVLAGVCRATFYAQQQPKPVDESDLLHSRLIDEEFTRHPFYGSRRMVVFLKTVGHTVNRKRVQKLMRQMGLAGMAPGPNTSCPHPEHKIYPYRLRGVAVVRPNQVWSTDISAPCRRGWRNPNHAGWLPTGSWNAALLGRDTEQKGAAKFCRVLTAGCHKQSSLNSTEREPFFTGRATTAFMVRQRSMRRKPLYLEQRPRQRNGVEEHGAMRPVLMLPAARCGYRI